VRANRTSPPRGNPDRPFRLPGLRPGGFGFPILPGVSAAVGGSDRCSERPYERSARYVDGTLFRGRCSGGVVWTLPPHLPGTNGVTASPRTVTASDPDRGRLPSRNPRGLAWFSLPIRIAGSGGTPDAKASDLRRPLAPFPASLPLHPGTPVCANLRKRWSMLPVARAACGTSREPPFPGTSTSVPPPASDRLQGVAPPTSP
jgi:hypothetical protein